MKQKEITKSLTKIQCTKISYLIRYFMHLRIEDTPPTRTTYIRPSSYTNKQYSVFKLGTEHLTQRRSHHLPTNRKQYVHTSLNVHCHIQQGYNTTSVTRYVAHTGPIQGRYNILWHWKFKNTPVNVKIYDTLGQSILRYNYNTGTTLQYIRPRLLLFIIGGFRTF